MSKKRVYSDDERVIRIWDIETVKDLMSRRQVMQMNNERREERPSGAGGKISGTSGGQPAHGRHRGGIPEHYRAPGG